MLCINDLVDTINAKVFQILLILLEAMIQADMMWIAQEAYQVFSVLAEQT